MEQNKFKRIIKHLLSTRHKVLNCFPKKELNKIEYMISQSEKQHMAEILCVIESGWDLKSLYREKNTRERALEWFGLTQCWDTELNTGVLIYVSFADKQIEIIADRGIAKLVSNEIWQNICTDISMLFKQGSYPEGINVGLEKVDAVLTNTIPRNHIPYHNQYPNQVIII
ncbi:MAG: hypothetical protein GKC53_01025 [Neisseriaceae bacterium]|nr:MAG: hypothetical protein GKC53_01025 [Neisseriaceae bacterium]